MLGTAIGAVLYRQDVENYLGFNVSGGGNSLPTQLEADTYYLRIAPGSSVFSDTIAEALSSTLKRFCDRPHASCMVRGKPIDTTPTPPLPNCDYSNVKQLDELLAKDQGERSRFAIESLR